VTNAGRLISGRGLDVKIQIDRNIRRLHGLVNARSSAESRPRRRLISLTICGLVRPDCR